MAVDVADERFEIAHCHAAAEIGRGCVQDLPSSSRALAISLSAIAPASIW
jgi:hypothetical protein